MIEHEPWRGPKCASGIRGQRIAIVGYSHHRNAKDADNKNFTINVAENFLRGSSKRDALFPVVPGYFGFEDRRDFWCRVRFFNFIPCCIGTDDKKYAAANSDLINRAKERFIKILQTERPTIQKVFVFTTKGWSNRPNTDREDIEGCPYLGPEFEKVTWGNYTFGRRTVLAFGMRHPLGAKKVKMIAAVREAMSRSHSA